MLKKGDVLDGKYEILLLKDRGGMAKVWDAYDTHVNKHWAVKEIDKSTELYKATVDEEKTLREVEIQKGLDHPSIARIVDIIDKEDALYIVTDLVNGDNLLRTIKAEGLPSQELAVSWMLDVCDAVSYLHSQNPPIIYRDMKPSNIMVNSDQRIKLIDFGIAKHYEEGSKDTQLLGTPGFAAPEARIGESEIRSDIYSIGRTLYQLLTGIDPSKYTSEELPKIRDVNPALSSGLEQIIEKATRASRSERYQTVSELASALESYKSLEYEHVEMLEKGVHRFRRKIRIAVAMIILGIFMTSASALVTARSYQGLVNATPGSAQAEASYIQAVELRPQRPEAYEKLLEEYTTDGQFDERELKTFLSIYENNKTAFSKNEEAYSRVCYDIGERILTYYAAGSDNSARARILQAEPFFEEVTAGEHASLAENYVFMAEFYRDFILADSSLVVKGVTKETLTDLLDSCSGAVEGLNGDFSGREKMKSIVYEFIIAVLDSKASEFHAAGIDRKKIEGLIGEMADDPECTEENRAAAKEALRSVERGYTEKNSKEVVFDDADT